MLRFVLVGFLLAALARAFWRIVDGIIKGLTEPAKGSTVPQRSVPMVRDPVCGTFVLPDRAVSVIDAGARVFFCSEACRDKYRARTA